MTNFQVSIMFVGATVAASIGPVCAQTFSPDAAEVESQVEARAWLKTEAGQGAFAEHEMTAREAERLVLRLYRAGALQVTVSFFGGDVNGFQIELPLDGERRADIFEVARRVHRRFGLALFEDEAQDVITVWIQ
jgi:hypothetical protein